MRTVVINLVHAVLAASTIRLGNAFVVGSATRRSGTTWRGVATGNEAGTAVEESPPTTTTTTTTSLSPKDELVDLLSRMTGQESEFRRVEALVNALEDGYQPTQTLDFFNLFQQGEWQLLFSTNLVKAPNNPAKFRLRSLIQRIDCHQWNGTLVNEATWDLAEAADGNFACTGTFLVDCRYEITQGSRMSLSVAEHIVKPAKGSQIPTDVPGLVGLLHRAMPKELFDPADHAVDTTYLDGDLRIVRYTGPRMEGVRDIFLRSGTDGAAWEMSS